MDTFESGGNPTSRIQTLVRFFTPSNVHALPSMRVCALDNHPSNRFICHMDAGRHVTFHLWSSICRLLQQPTEARWDIKECLVVPLSSHIPYSNSKFHIFNNFFGKITLIFTTFQSEPQFADFSLGWAAWQIRHQREASLESDFSFEFQIFHNKAPSCPSGLGGPASS